jgi:hypothetical protein
MTKLKKKKTTLFGNDIFKFFSDVMSLASILKERLIIKWQQVFRTHPNSKKTNNNKKILPNF